MITKIKLKLDRQAFDSVVTFTRYAADSIHVKNEAMLVAKEYLEELSWKLQRRVSAERKSVTVSMPLWVGILFNSQVLGVMHVAGDYERALANILRTEIELQINRAIQTKMFQ